MGILDLSITGRQQSRLFKKREGTRESGMPGEGVVEQWTGLRYLSTSTYPLMKASQ